MVISILWVIDFDVYALLDSDVNLSFVIPYLTLNFDVSPDILLKPFLIYTPICE